MGFAKDREKDDKLTDLFRFSDDHKSRIENMASISGTCQEKICHMVAYMSELAYDLAICPADNVSESVGFEACGFFVSNR